MFIENIHITGFKSILELSWQPNARINLIIGKNGTGKTNFLDAIYYMCLTKSFLGSTDLQNIHYDYDFFRIEGKFKNEQSKTKIEASFSHSTKKIFKINKEEYAKLSEHIGKLPVVLIAPDDTDLIRGGSELRRRFFDGIICQSDAEYLQNTLLYNHFLKQRNHLLKQLSGQSNINFDLLDLYDDKLIAIGHKIAEKRKSFLLDFIPFLEKHHADIATELDRIELGYETQNLDLDFLLKFKNARTKDLQFQRTTLGTHTDDYDIVLNQKSTKKYASQGQKKTIVIALKLAQYDFLEKTLSRKPILLLDDIFDKLDDIRIQKLIRIISTLEMGQVFLTDARKERSMAILQNISYQLLDMDNYHNL